MNTYLECTIISITVTGQRHKFVDVNSVSINMLRLLYLVSKQKDNKEAMELITVLLNSL
jgi:hypothetical protein